MINTVVDDAAFVTTSVHVHITSVPFMLFLVGAITGLETRGTLSGRETPETLKMMESVVTGTSIPPTVL